MIALFLGLGLLGVLLTLLVMDMVRTIGWRETGVIWGQVLVALVIVAVAILLIIVGLKEIST